MDEQCSRLIRCVWGLEGQNNRVLDKREPGNSA